MRLRGIACAALALLLGTGAAMQACSRLPEPEHPATPPPGIRTPLPEPPQPATLGGPLAAPGRVMDLRDFAPLLALPELAAAAQAYQNEDYRTSAESIRAALHSSVLLPLEELRWQLLLARVQEKAGLLLDAEQAYALAAQAAWPLADYAALGWGRALLSRAELEAGTRVLNNIPATGAPYADAQLLLAESSCQRLLLADCITQLERFVAFSSKPKGWAAESVRVLNQLIAGLAPTSPVPVAVGSAQQAVPVRTDDVELAVRALSLLRRLMIDAPRDARIAQADAMERRILALLPSAALAEHAELTPKDQLRQLRALVDAAEYEEAEQTAAALLGRLEGEASGEVACEARVLRAKAKGGTRDWAEAVAELEQLLGPCKGLDLRARALFMAGKYAFSDKRYTLAERLFARLEAEAPSHSLADDARLYRAETQKELGIESRFTELLTRMSEDYPKGDMLLDGIFSLALRRIEKGDWAGAAVVLRRGSELARNKEAARGPDEVGRERYFLARALIQTGETERGLKEYESIILQQPLSYYMLNAYSRLVRRDPERGQRALQRALTEQGEVPFSIGHREEFENPGFIRVSELLRQNEFDAAGRELKLMELAGHKPTPELWWGIALLYARAGSIQLSHAVARWRVRDWLERWPVGPWREAWEIAFPRPHLETVLKEAEQNALEPALVYAIMREESAFDAGAVSSANAYGLMQVIMPTARHYGKQAGLPHDQRALKTPRVNIALGTRVLSSYMAKFPGNPVLGIPGYNAGPGRPMRWIKDFPSVDFDVWVELIPLRETRRYTKRVLASRSTYRFLYSAAREQGDALLLPERLGPSDGGGT